MVTNSPHLSPSLTTGRVLNRFSKDIGFLDDLLPYVFCEYLLVNPIAHNTITAWNGTWYTKHYSFTCVDILFPQLLLRCLAIVVTAITINAWVMIPAFLLLSVFLAIRWYYLKTSRDIKRLEAVGGPREQWDFHFYILSSLPWPLFCSHLLWASLFPPSSSQSSLFSHINHFTRAAHDQDIW